MRTSGQIRQQGQSIWLDSISRGLIQSGELKQMVETGEVTGVTSNPTIFEKAIDGSYDHDKSLSGLMAANPRLSAYGVYEQLSVEDVRSAADVLRGVHDGTNGRDGFVSIELSPYLEELIERDTITTVPPATLEAFRDHGHVRGRTLEEGLPEATLNLSRLLALGIHLDEVGRELQVDGVAAFDALLNKLLRAIEAKQHSMAHA